MCIKGGSLLSVLQGLTTATTLLPSVRAHAWDRTLLRWVETVMNNQHKHTQTNITTHGINSMGIGVIPDGG